MLATIVKYDFIQNALIVGILLSFILPLIGIIVLFRKVPFIADALGHVNMSAVAFIYLLNTIISISNISSIFIILIWSITGGLIIEFISQRYTHYKEVSVMIIYSIAIAMTMIFLNLSVGFQSSLFNILFGNINTITNGEVLLISGLSIGIIGLFIMTYKKIILISIEEEYSKLYNVNLDMYRYISIVLISVSISISIKILGVLLVSALILIPNLGALKIAKNLKQVIMYGILITLFSFVLGTFIAYILGLSSSAVIVLIAVFIYFTLSFLHRDK